MPRSVATELRSAESRRLLVLRETLGLSQRDLAEQFSVAPSAIAQWETGDHSIPGPVLKLMELFEQEAGIQDEPELPNAGWGRSLTAGASWALWLLLMGTPTRHDSAITNRVRALALSRWIGMIGKLRGLPMKLGQMTSHFDFVLDEGERAPLRALQSTAKPMSTPAVFQLFLDELGHTPRQLFAEWGAQPIATASIGQVHRAVTADGQAVAVKLQQRGMVEAIESDLRHTRTLDALICVLWRGQKRGVIYEEIRDRILDECDYRTEAGFGMELAKLFEGRKGYRFPRVHPALSTSRILTTDFMSGQPLDAFVASSTQAQRNRAGQIIWDFYTQSMLQHGLFQADPHPGNFLFTEDEVVFLDFGRVRRWPAHFVGCWKQFIRTALERDRSGFRRELLEGGYIGRADGFDFDYALKVILFFYLPMLRAEPFKFTNDYVRQLWRAFGPENPNASRLSYSPETVFLNQFYFGVSALLARLGATIDCRTSMLDALYAPGERRPAPFEEPELALFGFPS